MQRELTNIEDCMTFIRINNLTCSLSYLAFLQGLKVWQQILHKSLCGCAATGGPSDCAPCCHLLFMKPTATSSNLQMIGFSSLHHLNVFFSVRKG